MEMGMGRRMLRIWEVEGKMENREWRWGEDEDDDEDVVKRCGGSDVEEGMDGVDGVDGMEGMDDEGKMENGCDDKDVVEMDDEGKMENEYDGG